MHNWRSTRLTNTFIKKLESLVRMVVICSVWCNFVRIQKSLRITPAMAAGLTDRFRSWEEIIEGMDTVAPKPGRPKTYKKRGEEASTEALPGLGSNYLRTAEEVFFLSSGTAAYAALYADVLGSQGNAKETP